MRTAEWTAEVMDVEMLAERINDPGRAATSAVVQVEDGDAWLELRSLDSGDAMERKRGREEADGRRTQESAWTLRYWEDHVQTSLGQCDAKNTWTTVESCKVSDGGAEDLSNDRSKTEGGQEIRH